MRMTALLALLALSLPALAGSPAVYEKSAMIGADVAYDKLYQALERRDFYVIFEPDMGRVLQGMAEKLGADYNRNQLTALRSLVFCNPLYTSKMSNADPAMLALCPLHVTLTHKAGVSTAAFIRTGEIAAGSPAEALARQIETEVVKAIEEAMNGQ
jgi:uncharacterized protein (DUF302 family)